MQNIRNINITIIADTDDKSGKIIIDDPIDSYHNQTFNIDSNLKIWNADILQKDIGIALFMIFNDLRKK